MTAKRDGDFRQGAMIAAVSDRQVASLYLAKTEDLIARQKKRTVEEVRPVVARSLKITASAADFIRRNRRKVVPSWLKENIVALFIDTAQAELRAIENEIQIARQVGLGNSDGKLIAARARAAALVDILDSISSEGAGESSQ
jgi:hypothetical protein